MGGIFNVICNEKTRRLSLTCKLVPVHECGLYRAFRTSNHNVRDFRLQFLLHAYKAIYFMPKASSFRLLCSWKATKFTPLTSYHSCGKKTARPSLSAFVLEVFLQMGVGRKINTRKWNVSQKARSCTLENSTRKIFYTVSLTFHTFIDVLPHYLQMMIIRIRYSLLHRDKYYIGIQTKL